ncbi:MAG TPA: biotin/lipoyl-containing protein [Solirubrobacterales bacterium]|nr:biotin/lipoyl-containing protein [Solirubrobacterales bacterium]
MVVEVGEDRLHVSRDQLTELAPAAPAAPAPAAPAPTSAPAPAPAAATPAASAGGGAVGGTAPEEASATGRGGGSPAATGPAAEAALASGTRIESPSVGLFWRAPSPGAPPFVEVGQQVAAGATVAIVEVMKLMNQVTSPVDGVVTGILVENGASVEFGQPIVVVDPEG